MVLVFEKFSYCTKNALNTPVRDVRLSEKTVTNHNFLKCVVAGPHKEHGIEELA